MKWLKRNFNMGFTKSGYVLLCSLLFIFLVCFLWHWIDLLPLEPDYSRQLTDRRGQLLHATLSRDQKWRLKTRVEEVPKEVLDFLIFKEDRYFYYHPGINPLAIARAAINNTVRLKRTSGASTISMQVVRLLNPRPRTYFAKLMEMGRAIQLECRLSKKEILELYLNLLPEGGNIEGLASASRIYFQKDYSKLSFAEGVLLCVIPNRPVSMAPGKNWDALKAFRNRWIKQFASSQSLSPAQLADAMAETQPPVRHEMPKKVPHFARLLMRSSPAQVLATGIDSRIQNLTEQVIKTRIIPLRNRGIGQLSVVIIDNRNRSIVAYAGSADYHESMFGGQVDGIQAIRQPGSTLKPLLYGLAFDQGIISPTSVLFDIPINYKGYAPENYDGRFRGPVTASFALSNSLNIPAVQVLHQLGRLRLVEALTKCGFQTIRKKGSELGLSLALGGCGTNLMELTALYAALACKGVFQLPRLLKSDTAGVQQFPLLSEEAAFLLTDILSGIARPDLPLNWEQSAHLPKVAWKTGTSYGRRDAWSIGYNLRYTIGVWAGNFSGEGSPDLNGAEIATPVLFDLFNSIDYASDNAWFNRPAQCEERYVCVSTGLPPGRYCSEKTIGYYLPGISPSSRCTHLKSVKVSIDGKMSFCVYCQPNSGYREVLFPDFAPEYAAWLNRNHLPWKQPPPHNPGCMHLQETDEVHLFSPVEGVEYLLEPGTADCILLQAAPLDATQNLSWFADQQLIATVSADSFPCISLSAGKHQITCVTASGKAQSVEVTVRSAAYR